MLRPGRARGIEEEGPKACADLGFGRTETVFKQFLGDFLCAMSLGKQFTSRSWSSAGFGQESKLKTELTGVQEAWGAKAVNRFVAEEAKS